MVYTGTSMGGGIINTRKVKIIPCDCKKCYHKSKIKEGKYTFVYCSYYGEPLSTNRSRCSKYYDVTSFNKNYNGKKSKCRKTSDNKSKRHNSLKICSSCNYYIKDKRMCSKYSFNIQQLTLAKVCKDYTKRVNTNK